MSSNMTPADRRTALKHDEVDLEARRAQLEAEAQLVEVEE